MRFAPSQYSEGEQQAASKSPLPMFVILGVGVVLLYTMINRASSPPPSRRALQ
jgi:hypothetical protein